MTIPRMPTLMDSGFVRRTHAMPWGTQCTAAGVLFQLWAPSASIVDLIIVDVAGCTYHRMNRSTHGRFERLEPAARAGTHYQFRIDDTIIVPDPASRYNEDDVSVVVDPAAFAWDDAAWSGRPWHEAVLYELHVGSFTEAGTFAAVGARLPHLASLGITLLELMPIGHVPGRRNWGYYGVLPFAPSSVYGSPNDLKALIAAAHRNGIGVILDVVYNHFGPQGNYLQQYAPAFFSRHHTTPWGPGINFDGEDCAEVRDFFRHNALYWIEEFNLDGLRFDAVHAMADDSEPHIVTEIAAAIRAGAGRVRHLVVENADNDPQFMEDARGPGRVDAQWNDDVHHCLHVILSGEHDGYYKDYADPCIQLAKGLAEGFVYQGQASHHLGRRRGHHSSHLPPTAFVNFLQNHDQIGNRARGERLSALVHNEAALRAAAAIILLAPSIPMLFMGEEWGAREPFPYFCDFEADLAERVRQGRREEFRQFAEFNDAQIDALPDPGARATFAASRVNWSALEQPDHANALAYHRELLDVRRRAIVPLIPLIQTGAYDPPGAPGELSVRWTLSDDRSLCLAANLSDRPGALARRLAPGLVFSTHPPDTLAASTAPWEVRWNVISGTAAEA